MKLGKTQQAVLVRLYNCAGATATSGIHQHCASYHYVTYGFTDTKSSVEVYSHSMRLLADKGLVEITRADSQFCCMIDGKDGRIQKDLLDPWARSQKVVALTKKGVELLEGFIPKPAETTKVPEPQAL